MDADAKIRAAILDLQKQINNLRLRLNTKDDQIQKLNDYITKVDAKTQRVNQAVGPLTANIPQDVTITWPKEWPDQGYGIYTQITTGNAILGAVHATPKSGSKTTTECVITVQATVAVAGTIGLDVLGNRT